MKIACGALAAIAALVVLTSHIPTAEAGRRADCRQGGPCHHSRKYVRLYADDGWFSFRFFGDFSGPCGTLLRKAIEINTPDPLLELLRPVHRHLMCGQRCRAI